MAPTTNTMPRTVRARPRADRPAGARAPGRDALTRRARAASVQLKYAAQPTPTVIAKLAHTKIAKFACVRGARAGPAAAARPRRTGPGGADRGGGRAGRQPHAGGGRPGRRLHLGCAALPPHACASSSPSQARRPGAEAAARPRLTALAGARRQWRVRPPGPQRAAGRVCAAPGSRAAGPHARRPRRRGAPRPAPRAAHISSARPAHAPTAQPAARAQAACGAATSFCCAAGGQLMAWGKLKTTDNTMYPKPFQDLSGWAVRSMACGASTYAVAAAGGGDESTITWRAPRARPPDARAAPAAGPSGARYGRRPLGRHADAAANAGTPERVRARAQGPGAQRRAGLWREREEELSQPRQVQRAGGRARAPGAAARASRSARPACAAPGGLARRAATWPGAGGPRGAARAGGARRGPRPVPGRPGARGCKGGGGLHAGGIRGAGAGRAGASSRQRRAWASQRPGAQPALGSICVRMRQSPARARPSG